MLLTIENLNGGIIDAVQPERISDEACQNIVDYEYTASGLLQKRHSSELYELTDANLGRLNSFAVWYPSRLPSDATSDKAFVVHSNGKIMLVYKAGGWQKVDLFTDVSSSYEVTYYAGYDRVLIADGHNPGRQISINKDGEIEYGEIGIDSPITLLTASTLSSDVSYAEVGQADVGIGVERGNILQYCYTVEDKYGNESNPSPISTIDSLVYKYPDADSPTGFKYYLKSITLNGFSIANYGKPISNKLKYYNLYRREIMFREGTISTQFKLVRQIAVGLDTTASAVDSSNDILTDISYDNDVAPASNVLIENAGVIYAGGVKSTDVRFPFFWDSYTEIGITNNNNIDYTNAVVAFKITSLEAGVDSWEMQLSDSKKTRVFFSDLRTPCPVVYRLVGNTLYCYVRLPYLNRGLNTIYMAFASESKGVSDDWDSYVYGRFHNSEVDNIELQKVFGSPTVDNNEHILSLFVKPDLYSISFPSMTRLFNLADVNSLADQYPAVYSLASGMPKLLWLWDDSEQIEAKGYTITGTAVNTFDTTKIPELPMVIQFTGNIKYVPGESIDVMKVGDIALRVRRDGSNRLQLAVVWNGDELVIATGTTAQTTQVSTDLTWTVIIQPDYVYSRTYCPYFNANEIVRTASSTVTLTGNDTQVGDINSGSQLSLVIVYKASVKNIGLLTTDDERKKLARCEQYSLNYYQIEVGADQTADNLALWENNGITFESKNFELETKNNVLQWSSVGGENFPALNFKRYSEDILAIRDASSFLKQQYQNTLLVFTRNTINRLVLSDDLTTMAGGVSNVISEFKSGGLYAPKSLVAGGDAFYWFSEAGVLRWSPDGMRNISRGRIRIPLSTSYIGVWVSELGQYWLHGSSDTLVYHEINDTWTRFSGINIQSVDYLNQGNDTDNKILYLYNGEFFTYPSEEYVDGGSIKTKRYYIGNHKLRRYRGMWERGTTPSSIKISIWNELTLPKLNQISRNLPMRGIWYNAPNGSWGETIEIELDNVAEFVRLELDII